MTDWSSNLGSVTHQWKMVFTVSTVCCLLVNPPQGPDAQGCFKRHTKTNGIHKKTTENYENFLRVLSRKHKPVNRQVTKSTQ